MSPPSPEPRKRSRTIAEWNALPIEEVEKLQGVDRLNWAHAYDVKKEMDEKAYKLANPVRGPKKWAGVTLVTFGYVWCIAVVLFMLAGCLTGGGDGDVTPHSSGSVVLLIPAALLISWGYKLQGKEMSQP